MVLAAPKKTITLRLPSPHKGGQEKLLYWTLDHPVAQVLVAPAGVKTGKALSLDTIIPTPDGYRKMGDLKEGDYVFNEHGKPVLITYATDPMYDHNCYEVEFSDGSKIIADEEHLWATESILDRRYGTGEVIRTTLDIKDTLQRAGRNNHTVKLLSSPLQYNHKDLPINPYLLGLWLGDGCLNTGRICKPDEQIFDEIRSLGYEVNVIPSDPNSKNIVGLSTQLRELGIRDNKLIPDIYLLGSESQRLSLIQGLMDTDGTIDKRGKCSFDNTNKNLVDGIEKLLCSFGIRTHRRQRVGTLNGVAKKVCYSVWFTTDLSVFKLQRKLDRLKSITARAKHRTIVKITSVPSVPVRCIRVNSPTHLFLCGETCIPTHNTYGSSLWMITEALSTPRLFCVWIAPTYLKCKIAYRYFKNFLPQDSSISMMDGLLEVRFGNGSFVKFMHGRDAETTIEGEAVDRFVIDEAGKIVKQVWISLTTTITQTRGKGIVTGTPRGLTWYYDIAKQAQRNEDPFFCYTSMKTEDSPFVTADAIARAKKLLPPHLFAQYYLAEFISHSSTFGNLDLMWSEVYSNLKPYHEKFWLAGEEERKDEIVHGLDIAKKMDFTVIYSVNTKGQLVGFCRFQHVPYPQQVIRLKTYLTSYFAGAENTIKFDATGVGVSFEDMLEEAQLEASLYPVSFTSKSKSEMITKAVMAIQSGWHKAPRLKCIAHEFAVYELSVTSTGHHKYGAPEGEHDDVVSAAILAISGAYVNSSNTENEKLLEAALRGESLDDIIGAYSAVLEDDENIFVTDDDYDGEEVDIDFEND